MVKNAKNAYVSRKKDTEISKFQRVVSRGFQKREGPELHDPPPPSATPLLTIFVRLWELITGNGSNRLQCSVRYT